MERDSQGRFLTGNPKTGGRKKGSANKHTGEIREMIRQALEEAGGVKYLARVAQETPTAFLALIGRLVPSEIRASLDAGLITVEMRSFTGMAWETEAERLAAKTRVEAIEAVAIPAFIKDDSEIDRDSPGIDIPVPAKMAPTVPAEPMPEPTPEPEPEKAARGWSVDRSWERERKGGWADQ